MAAKQQISKFFSKIERVLKEAVNPKSLAPLARFAVDIIVKRTRLGYGVKKTLGQKEKLKPLSESYILQRQRSQLSQFTTAKRSNLTRTGQMLESVKVISIRQGQIIIGPSGRRNDSRKTNDEIAEFNEQRGRIFNKLSALEFQQLLREYRRTFGDLVVKRKLIS